MSTYLRWRLDFSNGDWDIYRSEGACCVLRFISCLWWNAIYPLLLYWYKPESTFETSSSLHLSSQHTVKCIIWSMTTPSCQHFNEKLANVGRARGDFHIRRFSNGNSDLAACSDQVCRTIIWFQPKLSSPEWPVASRIDIFSPLSSPHPRQRQTSSLRRRMLCALIC